MLFCLSFLSHDSAWAGCGGLFGEDLSMCLRSEASLANEARRGVLIESKCKEFTGTALEGCQQRTRTQIEKEEQELQEMLRQENDQSFIEMMEVHINKYQTDFGHILAKSERGKQYLSETIVALTQWGDRGLNLIKVIR